MTRAEVITRVLAGKLNWVQAADILGISPRQMRRLKTRWEKNGYDGILDQRGNGSRRRLKIDVETLGKLYALRRDRYSDLSVQHFYEKMTEEHGFSISYNWMRQSLQTAGLAEKAPSRGQYRRKRARRPMRGMMIHCDASTHEWIEGLGHYDLIVFLDDADSRILYARFVPQEGTRATLEGLLSIFQKHGRFSEFYTDRGSHFCRTSQAGQGPDAEQNGVVSRILETLGVRAIYAHSPQARGRSERMFQTLQGRLPQELRLAKVTNYDEANAFLDGYIPELSKRFEVQPASEESAFTPIAGIDLELLLSISHERKVQNDNTVQFQSAALQLESTPERFHFARCKVFVHELLDRTLAVVFQGRIIGRFQTNGTIVRGGPPLGSLGGPVRAAAA